MAKLGISTGTIPDDGTGDSLLDGAIKINSNFSELYTLLGDGTTLTSGIVTSIVAGSNITVSGSTGQVTVNADSPKNWETTAAGIHTLSNVGIGTTNPTSKLTVTGSGLFTGVVTATSFSGSGSNLTGIVTGITAGANITVLESPSGNFIITSTSSGSAGAGGTWAVTTVGIHTLKNVGIGTTNPTSALTVKGNTSLETLNVSGVSTFPINVAVGVDFTHQGGGIGKFRISGDGVYGNGRIGYYDSSNNLTAAWDSYPPTGSIDIYNYTNSGTQNITISAGSSVVLQHGGTNTKLQTLGTGVTITGTTFTNQLSVSGISTLGNTVVGGATTQLIVSGDARVTGILTVGTASITLNGSTNQLLVGTGVTIYGNTGIVSATKFYGDGSSITGVIAAGVGITVRDGGGDLGSAEVIDFGDNLTVSFSSGIATVTGSAGGGGSSQWVTTAAGIHTLSNVGIGTTNPTSPLTVKGNTSLETLSVSGVSTFNGITYFTGGSRDISISANGVMTFADWQVGNANMIRMGDSNDLNIYHDGTKSIISETGTGNLEVKTSKLDIISSDSEYMAEFVTDGAVNLYYDSSKKFETLGTGVTVTGTTFTDQLSVSGVSTFGGTINANNVGAGISVKLSNSVPTYLEMLGVGDYNATIKNIYNGDSSILIHSGAVELRSGGINNYSVFNGTINGTGQLMYRSAAKLSSLIDGVQVYGTTFTDELSVSGVSTFSGAVGIGTTNPITQLQVGRSGTQSGFGTFSASVGVSTTIDTFETSFLTAEYTVHIGYGTYIQAQKVLVMNNGSTAYSQEYAIMYEPSQIVSVGATVSGANVLLQVTPQTGVTGLTTYRFVRNSLI